MLKNLLAGLLAAILVISFFSGPVALAADPLTVEGTALDSTLIMKINNEDLSLNNQWTIHVTSGTLRGTTGADLTADVTLTGLPSGFSYAAGNYGGNDILLTLSGAASTALTADVSVSVTIKGSAVNEANAQDSASISLDIWYIGPGTTFVLSNESGGYLIDKLIAAGYGDKTLFEVLQILQPYSGGVITDRFMLTLASCPAGSEIFDTAAKLSNFAGLNNPVCVNADGTLSINPILGRDYFGHTGYNTFNDRQNNVGLEFFTHPISSAYYIDAGASSPTIRYQAFAIAWSPRTAQSFFLSNEAGGYLINQLVAAGYGNNNLYEVMQVLKPHSNGVITDAFMAQLAACPPDSDIFTAELYNFTDPSNNPVGIDSDGTLIVAGLYGRDINALSGYITTSSYITGAGYARFTRANGYENYIDAGALTDGDSVTTYYEAFAVAWSAGDPPNPRGVGGEVEPSSKFSVMFPWLVLMLALAVGGTILVLSRRKRS